MTLNPRFGKAPSLWEAVDSKTFHDLVQLSLQYSRDGRVSKGQLDSIKGKMGDMSQRDFECLLNLTFSVVRKIMRLPRETKSNRVQEIIQEFRVPPTLSNVVEQLFSDSKKSDVKSYITTRAPTFPSVQGVTWKLDVVQMPDSMYRPVVILEIKTNDGKSVCLQCDLETFHKVRLSIAKAFKELTSLRDRLSH